MSLECKAPPKIDKIAALCKRAELLEKTRAFFKDRSVMEVDTPALCQYAAIDAAIQVMEVILSDNSSDNPKENRYLHTSPEYGMKRLLALGIGDIYQLSHVFRKYEFGKRHNPEFSMCEWYRIGWEFLDFVEEVIQYTELFVGKKKRSFFTYEEAFLKYFQVSSQKSTLDDLREVAKNRGCSSPLNYEEVLDFLYSELGKDLAFEELVIIYDFPPSKAALSEVVQNEEGLMVAKRFEIFHKGFELANGFKELTDPVEQKRRLDEEAALYLVAHQKDLSVDPYFIEALEKGVPSSCGVACGFDRLVMLALDLRELGLVLPWSWEEA